MKGCAISATLQVLSWLATGAGIVVLLERRFGLAPRKTYAPAMFVALLLLIAIGLVIGALRLMRERAQLAAALRGEPPRDGERVVLAGTIHAIREPLISPFSAQSSVAFRYDISRWSGTGRQRSLVTLVDGVALTQSQIRTTTGEYRLLAVPTFDMPAQPLDSTAKRRAEDHLRFGRFTEPPPAITRPDLEKEWSDDDGAYRRERRFIQEEIDLDQCILSEYTVGDGSEVLVTGLYSAERRAIVADPNWAHLAELRPGVPAEGARRLRERAMRYVAFAVLFLLGAGFMAYSAFWA